MLARIPRPFSLTTRLAAHKRIMSTAYRLGEIMCPETADYFRDLRKQLWEVRITQ